MNITVSTDTHYHFLYSLSVKFRYARSRTDEYYTI